MTITTDLYRGTGEEFSRRPSTSKVEAFMTLGAGAALAAYAMMRRTWSSVPLGAGGGYLLYCGVSQLRRPYQGRFRKAPGNRGTEVSVALEYKAPGGAIARSLAALVGWEPEQVVRESLRHLKQLTEAGEIPTTAGQPVGRRGMKGAALRVLYREG